MNNGEADQRWPLIDSGGGRCEIRSKLGGKLSMSSCDDQ